MTLFQQWETEMEKTEEQGKKLAVSILLSFVINLL